jgi:hypothetical protein
MMTLEEVLQQVQEPGAAEALRPHWEETAVLPDGAIPPFLLPEAVARHREWCGFGPEAEAPLLEAAAQIAADPALRLLAAHCERLLFVHTDSEGIRDWPTLERALGDRSGLFYLLIALSMVPRVQERHRELGVPEEVSRETCLQVSCFAENYRRGARGQLGIYRQQLYWLRHYPAGRLFRLGRFEYMLQPYRGGVDVYRHRETGDIVALAPAGMRYDADGYALRKEEERGWLSTRDDDEETIVGYPISPQGMAVQREVRLPRREWEAVLVKGDETLDMHIPAGGGMTPERCADSMRRAAEFFRRHFPDRPFASITCGSWIFNTQLDGILPPTANLVAYQRELYLYPIPSGPTAGLWFLFFQEPFDAATAPRDTAVQRAVLDFLAEEGHTWRVGAMFFLTEHLDRYGTQHYRSHWPPAALRDQLGSAS